MRRKVIAERLGQQSPNETIHALRALISLGGRGDTGVSQVLSALVACLEPPSNLPYETRSDLYSAANEMGAPEIAYILLEGHQSADPESQDVPRPIIPNGQPLSLGARKSAARTRDRTVLPHLLHDPHVQVIEILLDNPNVSETDVLVMASKRPTSERALRRIANHPRWAQQPRIRLSVALNPSCPLPLACRLCLDLRDSALRQLAGNAGSPALLRAHADRLVRGRRANDTTPQVSDLKAN